MNAIDKAIEPCPFCGSDQFDPEIIEEDNSWSIVCVTHMEGGCSAEIKGYTTKEYAIAAWNTRTPPADTICISRQELESWKQDKDKQGYWSDGEPVEGLTREQKGYNALIDKLLER